MSGKQRHISVLRGPRDQLLHGYTLPVFFATDQLHRPPRSAQIQSMSQQDASATRIGTR